MELADHFNFNMGEKERKEKNMLQFGCNTKINCSLLIG